MAGDRAMIALYPIMPLFNYGPSIEALREASQAKTEFPARKQPVWTTPLLLAAE
jgi:hypothetical protein